MKLPEEIEDFAIRLDNDRTLFIPGQKVEGFVVLNLKKPLKLLYLRVRFSGKVLTKTHPNENMITNETSSITMFKDFSNLVGEPGYEVSVLESGEYVYPFSFRMPATNLPASFIGQFGYVKYQVGAVLVRKNLQKIARELLLTVPSTKNSNDTDMQDTSVVKESGSAGLGPWKAGMLHIEASLPKKGYPSEQNAPINLKIVNNSNHGLIIQSIALKQRVTYTTLDRKRGPRTEKVHYLPYSEYLPAHIVDIDRLINFAIPPTSIMEPDIDTLILTVKHCIDIKLLSMARFSKVIKVQLPIVITGFPFLLFEDVDRTIHTLPRYIPGTDSQRLSAEVNQETEEQPTTQIEPTIDCDSIAVNLAREAIHLALEELNCE